MNLIFATNNKHKVEELKSLLNGQFSIITLKEAGIDKDIPEPHDTLEANAGEKSKTIYNITGRDCFGEDTGLEVDALNGAPGVKSARYAGEENSFEKNVAKLLLNLQGITDRKARFRTVISLILDGKEYLFEGICNGRILESAQGAGGFGYDPVFVPENAHQSFAEMGLVEKNRYSHRARAVQQLTAFLLTYAKSGAKL